MYDVILQLINPKLVVYPERRHDCRLELGLRTSGCAARGASESCLCTLVFAHGAILQQARACRLQLFFSPPSTPLSFACSWILAAYFITTLCYSYIATYIHAPVVRIVVPRPSELEAARLPTHPRSSPRLIFTQVGAAIGAGTPSGAPPK